jgi:hypothetical protein
MLIKYLVKKETERLNKRIYFEKAKFRRVENVLSRSIGIRTFRPFSYRPITVCSLTIRPLSIRPHHPHSRPHPPSRC